MHVFIVRNFIERLKYTRRQSEIDPKNISGFNRTTNIDVRLNLRFCHRYPQSSPPPSALGEWIKANDLPGYADIN